MSNVPSSPPLRPQANVKSPPNSLGSALPSQRTPILSNKPATRDDITKMDPDDVFAKHTVHEVRSILHRLKSDVDAKQEELRLMVGERYRDLLEASTSIIAMSRSSKRIVETVAKMQRIVVTDLYLEESSSKVKSGIETDDVQLRTYQSLAAHLKFLVDSPEHLWRLLERRQCLSSAWLFLLSRVVYRSLVSDDSDEGQSWKMQGILVKEQFPLVQRQWEIISQFRVQISHRAALSLRELDLRPENLCASIFTLHLLDSLPLSDALDVFLKQRSRTLQNLYQSITESWDKSASAKDGVKNTWNALRSVLSAIVGTVGNAHAVFGEIGSGSPSMITQLLVFSQSESDQASKPLPAELCLSSHGLIFSLPNSSHFQSLPPDIRSYRPFIDLDSQSSRVSQDVLDSKLRTWFTKATEQLHGSSHDWLRDLSSIKAVWELRSSAMDWLTRTTALLRTADAESLQLLVDNVCRDRMGGIWSESLGRILATFEQALQSAIVAIAEQKEATSFDISPSEYLLSAPPAPSIAQASLNNPLAQSSLRRFKDGVRQRIEGITPLVNKISFEPESIASSLHSDLNHVSPDENDGSFGHTFVADSEKTANNLLDSIRHLLDTGVDSDKRTPGPPTSHLYLLARLAKRLSLSPLMDYLQCSSAFRDTWRKRAHQIYESCVEQFSSTIALSVEDKFLGSNTPSLPSAHPHHLLPSQPSPEMMDSLLSLVGSVEKFAVSKDALQRSSVARTVLSRFTSAVIESSSRSADRLGLERLWDFYFLKSICDGWGEALSELSASLDQALKRSYQGLSSDELSTYPDLEERLQQSVSQAKRQTRLILAPLLPPSDTLLSVGLLNPPVEILRQQKSAGVTVLDERDMQPMMNLVKPSARFGLLWVASAAAQ